MKSIKSMGLFKMNNLEEFRQIESMGRVYLESMRVYGDIKNTNPEKQRNTFHRKALSGNPGGYKE